MNEVTIDLGDLFKKILSRWKTILCLGICFAILGGWYGYDSAVKNVRARENRHMRYLEEASEMPDYFTEELYNLRSSLSENAASFAEAYAKVYSNFLERYCDDAYDPANDSDLEAYMMFLVSYKDVLSVMGGTQRVYFERLISADKTADPAAEPAPFSPEEVSVFQTKWIIVGFLGGVILACVCVALPYLATRKLRTARDLTVSFGVPLLAVTEKASDTETDVLTTGIGAIARKNGLHSIALWGCGDREAAELRETLFRKFRTEDLQVISCDQCEEQEFRKRLADAEAAVLVERKGKSRYSDIRNETETCRNYGVELIGSIVIR